MVMLESLLSMGLLLVLDLKEDQSDFECFLTIVVEVSNPLHLMGSIEEIMSVNPQFLAMR